MKSKDETRIPKDTMLRFRVTETQWVKVRRIAEAHGISESALLRAMVDALEDVTISVAFRWADDEGTP